ncbi:conserved hypothetical protein [Ricinus communis]|uniref:Uncharacterized protein n=1 Tax=Ricinus communis TaxID=3988 RepID=B9S0R1_RICCO|nr:conserved hypothetical protein [Ricinus communis]
MAGAGSSYQVLNTYEKAAAVVAEQTFFLVTVVNLQGCSWHVLKLTRVEGFEGVEERDV